MSFYSIGDVAERCGINPVTLRAWQRRYGLLKPQRSEGGHRQFDEEDIQRIEEIKRWIKSGVPVGKVKALLEESQTTTHDDWSALQEEMMAALRSARPARLRAKISALGREHPCDALIDHVFVPVRQRLSLDQNTARIMCSLLDGVLIEFVTSCLSESRRKAGKDALLMGWDTDDRTRLWLEAWRLSQRGWHIAVLAEPLESPRPELFPGQQLFVWTGVTPTRRQQELIQHWHEQGYSLAFHLA
ncbi:MULTISPECIES: MerR family transcriptional regulator [unclassified Klebsiella]|uniref:MerR family transcriptional regulator n=1 Tax=Enterobacteriaceae TaxID=543 RepID=UPI0015DBCF58|nr:MULTISPECIES: MerR family transcriptional regulator [unclassified Klebsiella]BBR58381.1 HTH-type transcriptional repressor BluR [Klebsiella sp. WP4-W18-ESBL-05]BBS97357.1 HTH-type transcriptional repressor BluR [Klebsiella sp. WP7-S18-CRE-03]BBT02424.1 HTH-type transcriptional repressor BluR [Klebsiella sp. WP7-S18-ESBL-04]HAT3955074.1 MerR family transcriptional regulator [Kluyvera ascorbata]